MTRIIGGALMLAIWLLVLPAALSAIIPPSIWLDVRSVVVEDSVEGVAPNVIPDRVINRSFRGEWSVYVMKITATGIEQHCPRAASLGIVDFRKGALPNLPTDLDTWLRIPPNPACVWSPGQYRLTVIWTIHLWGGIDLDVEVDSNLFNIRPGVAGGSRA